MMYRTLALAALVLITPLIGNAQGAPSVLISEIAWMGTDADPNNEWIEIYNLSNSPTDLAGWTIVSADGKISITLKCTLAPHGVAVLERTDESTLPDFTALLTYTGDLVNSGTTLTLSNSSGTPVDQVDGGSNWSNVGGTNDVPKMTAQRTRTGSWATATPTPMGQATAGDVGNSVTCPPAENTSTQTTSSNSSSRSGGGGGSAKRWSASAPKENVPPKLALSIDGPKTAYVNQEVTFTAVPSGVGPTIEKMLSYDWNFGDTYTGKGKEARHIFEYPGEYVVVTEGSAAKQYAMARQEVKVLPVSFTLSRNAKGDIEVKNNANYETDLGGFSLRGGIPFTFPKHTFVKANGTLVVPGKRIGNTSSLSLHDSQGVSVFALGGGTPAPRPQIVVSGRPGTVTAVPASDAPVASAESTVIRIGEPSAALERGFLGSFFARIARMFGS